MGCGSSKVGIEPVNAVPPQLYNTFKAAGIVFRNSIHILGGYQAHKKVPGISGFGGMRKGNEQFFETAWRETLEELYGCDKIPESLLNKIYDELPAKLITQVNGYIFALFTFTDLKTLMNLVRKAKLPQTMYSKYPRTLQELVFTRIPTFKAEVNTLCLLPIVRQPANHPLVVRDFVKDIEEVVVIDSKRKTS